MPLLASTTSKSQLMAPVVTISDEYEKLVHDLREMMVTHPAHSESLSTQIVSQVTQTLSKANVLTWLATGLRILVIIGAFLFLWRVIHKIFDLYITRIKTQPKLSRIETSLVVETVLPIVKSTLRWIIVSITGLLVLSEVGINIMPIIYSLSVVGLAVSIGSNTLVKDFINGLMTLLEGNMAVGDYVTIAQNKGTVESITLRCVHLRHDSGELQTISFSEVNSVINHSRDYHNPSISFLVGHQASYLDVQKAMEEALTTLKSQHAFSHMIHGPLVIRGIQEISELGVRVSANVKISPDPKQHFIKAYYAQLFENLQKYNVPFARPV